MNRSPRIDDLNRVQLPSDPALSPDGKFAVYTVRNVNRATDAYEHQLWMLDATTGQSAALTEGTSDLAPRWSPNGKTLAFLRNVNDVAQIHLIDVTLPAVVIVATDLPLGADAPVWSPDGTQIAFCAPVVPEPMGRAHQQASTRLAHAPIVIRELGYKADGSRERSGTLSQLHVLEVSTLSCRALTNSTWNVSAPAWHPDGSSLLVVGAGELDADRQGTCSVYRVAVASAGAPPELFALSGGSALSARWTESATSVLVVGQQTAGVGHSELLEFDESGNLAANLSSALDRNLILGSPGYPGARPQQSADGVVLFCARDQGVTQVFSVELGRPETYRHVLGTATELVMGMSVSGSRVAVVTMTPSLSAQVSIVELATGEVVAAGGPDREVLADVDFIEPVQREFTLKNGTAVQGWVIRHASVSGATPLLLDIHGGPHNAWNGIVDDTHLYHQVLAARGWTVLIVNPPASDGYGEEFFMSNLGAWGHGDESAFLEPIDSLIGEGLVDGERLAVAGYSYGGFSTCWLTSHTDRFVAAIAGGLICDTTSLATSDEGYPYLFTELGATPWGDRDALFAQSPYASVSAVTTPTLILHGAEDDRCPVSQAEQWFVALRAQGVSTELVVYPGASHLFVINGRPSHRVDYADRLLGWLDSFVTTEHDN